MLGTLGFFVPAAILVALVVVAVVRDRRLNAREEAAEAQRAGDGARGDPYSAASRLSTDASVSSTAAAISVRNAASNAWAAAGWRRATVSCTRASCSGGAPASTNDCKPLADEHPHVGLRDLADVLVHPLLRVDEIVRRHAQRHDLQAGGQQRGVQDAELALADALDEAESTSRSTSGGVLGHPGPGGQLRAGDRSPAPAAATAPSRARCRARVVELAVAGADASVRSIIASE